MLGELLKMLRTERNLSKYALEKASRVNHADIFMIEEKGRVPTPSTVTSLANGLGLTDIERQLFFLAAIEDAVSPYREEMNKSSSTLSSEWIATDQIEDLG